MVSAAQEAVKCRNEIEKCRADGVENAAKCKENIEIVKNNAAKDAEKCQKDIMEASSKCRSKMLAFEK
jgi:hypothetical protein